MPVECVCQCFVTLAFRPKDVSLRILRVPCFRMLSELSEWFWQERLWFPEGLGWADLEDKDGRIYAKGGDLWVALPIALMFLVVRQIFERSAHFTFCLAWCVFVPHHCLCLFIYTFAFLQYLVIYSPHILLQLSIISCVAPLLSI